MSASAAIHPTHVPPQRLAVDLITLDHRLQMRERNHRPAYLAELTAHIQAHGHVEPIVVFRDPATGVYMLADGFARTEAHVRAGLDDILATVITGDFRSALQHALAANAAHGLPRSDRDKRNAVRVALTDPEYGTWTNTRIAELCRVSDKFVETVRATEAVSAEPKLPRTGRDGKLYPAKRKQRTRRPANQPTALPCHPDPEIVLSADPETLDPPGAAPLAPALVDDPAPSDAGIQERPDPQRFDLDVVTAQASAFNAMLRDVLGRCEQHGTQLPVDHARSDTIGALHSVRDQVSLLLAMLEKEPRGPTEPAQPHGQSKGRYPAGSKVRMTVAAQKTWGGSLPREDLNDLTIKSANRRGVTVQGRSGKTAHIADLSAIEAVERADAIETAGGAR